MGEERKPRPKKGAHYSAPTLRSMLLAIVIVAVASQG